MNPTTPLKENTPPECIDGNYRNLVGKDHEHRHLDFATKSPQFLYFQRGIHDRTDAFDFKWFRFTHTKTTQSRMLERTEIPQKVRGHKVSTFFALDKQFCPLSLYNPPPINLSWRLLGIWFPQAPHI